jgi:tetratricopeptide (TPR) repeat protein
MKLVFVIIIAIGALLPRSNLLADQTAPELDEWFVELATTDDQHTARELSSKIWNTWLQNDREDITNLMSAGIKLMSVGQLPGALAQFDRIVELVPEFAEGWNKRATVLYFMNRPDDSVADIKQTLLLEPRHFGALSGLGLILMDSGDHTSALTAFERAQQVNPHAPGILENIEQIKNLLKKSTI